MGIVCSPLRLIPILYNGQEMTIRITYPIFILSLLGTIAMIVYPPIEAYQYFQRGTFSAFQGYFWIFTEPDRFELTLRNRSSPYVLKVDLVRLVLQIVAWWLFMLIFCVRRK